MVLAVRRPESFGLVAARMQGKLSAAEFGQSDARERREGKVSYVQIQFAVMIEAVENHMPQVIVVDASAIVEVLLRDHLIACSQRTERIVSRYWWKGSLEQAEEWLVFLKTRADLASEVINTVVRYHPYETPEVITFPIVGGAPGYLAWIDTVTSRGVVRGRDGASGS